MTSEPEASPETYLIYHFNTFERFNKASKLPVNIFFNQFYYNDVDFTRR